MASVFAVSGRINFSSVLGKINLSSYRILPISWSATINLRNLVLRPGQPPDACQFPLDKAPDTFHLGLYDSQDSVIAVATFYPEVCHLIKAVNAYRLRGMAVHPESQRKGLGKMLLAEAESSLKDRRCDMLWFNARENAFPFYQSLNFRFASEMFDIPGVGAHKVMYKRL